MTTPKLYPGTERRKELHFSEDQIEQIAERAAVKAMAKLTDDTYRSIGKNVVSKFLWIVGVMAAALFFWAAKQGWVK